MKPEISALLADLNRAFYTGCAEEFHRTRRTWPLGYERILPHLRNAANELDLGCGNGRLLGFLADRGWRGRYVGVDASRALLAAAAQRARALPGIESRLVQADLLAPQWPLLMSAGGRRPDAITCLAVLHHIPAQARRRRFLEECAALLAPGGCLIVSTWQFMAAQRLRERVLPWETLGLTDRDVEPGDHLVAWGAGRVGRRYCAFIDGGQLAALASGAGLTMAEAFYSDGREGNLNLYAVLTAR